jgi:small subunit ribosomal protein S1
MSKNSDQKSNPSGSVLRRRSAPQTPAEGSHETPAAEPQEAPPEPVRAPVGPEEKSPKRRVVDMKKLRAETKPAGSTTLEKKPEPTADEMRASRDDFAAMLAGETQASVPKAAWYQVGDRVDGTVISVGAQHLFIALDGGHEATAERSDYESEGELQLAEGQTTTFFVVRTRGGLAVGKGLSRGNDARDNLETAAETGMPMEGKVVEVNKGGFQVEIQGVKTFCPISQIEVGFTEEPSVHVGQTYRFRIQEVREEGRNVIVSRAALIREEMEAQAKELKKTLTEGQVVGGVVTRLADFGAFVDLGGIEGLIHVSELSFTRVNHPSEVVKAGQSIDVFVKSIEGLDTSKPRIGLSVKDTLEDPWDTLTDRIEEGAIVEGRVVRLEQFGAFVEIVPGIEGLVHISEMSWKGRVKHPSDVVQAGDTVRAHVLSIDLQRQRVSLSLKAADEDPWSNVSDMLAEGMTVEGVVEKIEDFGAFVQLPSGLTALIPRSEMGLSNIQTPQRLLKVGQSIQARVLTIDTEQQRMALTLKAESQTQVAAKSTPAPRSFDEGKSGSFGTLGDLLQSKLEK